MSTRSLTTEAAPAKAPKHGATAGLAQHTAVSDEAVEFDLSESCQVRGNPVAVRPNRQQALVLDDDEARAFVTRWLVDELAPLLGLDPSRVEIQVNGVAEARVNARGATGLMESGRVYLHPDRYDPRTPRGRYLLAHETAHVAQRSLPGPATRTVNAEAEAQRIGEEFASRAHTRAPEFGLPALAAAADKDAPAAPPDPPPLSESVRESRFREIGAIKKLLGGWWVSDGDVFGVLEILEAMPFDVGVAVVQALEPGERYDLVNNVNPPHFKKRRQVLECYQALEAEKFHKFDEDLFEDMDLGGLDAQEQEAAFFALSHLPPKAVAKLLKSSNRLGVEGVINAPALDDKAKEKLRAEQRRAAEEESEAAKARRKFENTDSRRLMAQIRSDLGVKPKGDEKAERPNGHAVDALDTLAPLRSDRQQLQYIGELMEDEGLIDRLLDKLSAKQRFDTAEHRDTLLGLMATRLPNKNVAFAEDLLSYGFFDWRISDDEAEFAYRLIKFLPLAVQQRFRRRDHGKWLLRIEEQINKKTFSKFKGDEPYEGIEVRETSAEELKRLKEQGFATRSEDGLLDVANVYAQEAGSDGFDQALESLKKRFQDKLTEDSAAALHRDIAALAIPSGDPKDAKPGAEMRRMEAIVRELDRAGYIDKLFGELSDKFLFGEENRATTLRIMVSRDPIRVAEHARDLLSRGFLGLGMVNDREAWLAFQLIRALPDAEREAFIHDEPELWSRIQGEMSKGMRSDSELNAYIGDKGGMDRASVLGQLTQADTWSGDNVNRLEGLIRMAIAMTEYKFVFEQSKAFQAAGNTKLAQLVDDYKLYDPKVPRTEYNPKEIERTKWYEEGIFATARELIKGIAFLWNNNFLLFQRSVGVRHLDLNELQDVLGGDISGVQLAQRGPSKDKKQKTAVSENANKVTLLVDIGAHVAEASLPDLAITSVNYQSAGVTFQSGNITLKNLRMRASYDTDELLQPTQGRVNADSLEFNDLLLIFRGSMVSIKRILLAGFRALAGTTDAGKDNSAKTESGAYLAFPFMTTISALVYYLFKVKGWGTEKPGTEVRHGEEQVRAFELGFDSLEVTGVTTSGGQYVGRVEIRDFALRAGANKTTYLRAQIGSLDKRIRRLQAEKGDAGTIAKLTAERNQASEELKKLEPAEKRFLELQRKSLHDEKHFTDADRKELDALQQGLIGGAFVDIGGVKVSGVTGNLTAEDIEIGAIHGEGKSAAAGLSFATDPEMIQRLTAGQRKPSVADQAGDAQLDLQIEKIETGKITVRGIPTPEEIAERLKAIDELRQKKHDETLLAEDYGKLQELGKAAQRYQRFAAIGVSSLKLDDRAQFDKDYDRLVRAPELIDLTIQHIRLDQVHAGLGPQGVSLGAGEARITGVKMPAKGVSVREFHARNLRASANAEGGVKGWLDWRKNLTGASAGADLIEIKGLKSKFSGIGAEEITLEDLGVDATRKDKSTTVGVHAKKIEVKGVTVETSLAALRYQYKKLLEKQPKDKKPSKADQEKLADLKKLIDGFEGTMSQITDAEKTLADDTATEAEKEEARKSKQSAQETLEFLQKEMAIKRLTINDLNIEVSGLGDVLDPDYALPDKGIKIQGGVDKEGKRTDWISGASVEGAGTQHGSLGGTWIDNASVGAVRGSVTYGDDRIDFDGLQIDRLELGNFAYLGPGTTIWGSRGKGPTGVVSKLSVTGHVLTPLRDEKAPDGDRYMSQVVLDQFHIESIQGNGLHYRDDKAGLEVELKAATLRQIDAEGVTVNLPKSDDEHLLIQGGTAGVGALENARIAATTGSGMAINTQVSATGLTAKFAEDGVVTVDLAALGASGHVTSPKGLDVEFNAKARGLHVQVIPGKKGYDDATKKYSVRNLDELSAKGTAAGTRFDVKSTGGSVGEVTDDGRTISAPEISLPDIQLNSLHFENPKYKADVPDGSPISITGTELGVKLERNQDPKTKEDQPFSRIVITKLFIPKTTVRGLTLVVKKYDLTLSLPTTEKGTIEDIYVMGDDKNPEGLVIEPTKDWAVLGTVGFVKANLNQLTANIPGVLKDATADVGVNGFSIGFLSDGTMPIDLAKLTLTNASGEVKGTKFWLRKGDTKYTGTDPGVTVEGIRYGHGEKGLEIDSVGINGLKFRNDVYGLTLDIEKATLPGDNGFKMPKSGPIDIPRLDIQNAFFHIDDLMHMGPAAAGGGPATKVDPKAIEFLDFLEGDIVAVLKIDADYLSKLQTDFPLVIHIRGGRIDYAKFQDKLLTSHVLRQSINFTVKGDKLVIEFDPSTILAEIGAVAGTVFPFIGPIVGPIAGEVGGSALSKDVYSWQLPPREVDPAKQGKARLGTLVKPFLPDGTPATSGPSKADEYLPMIHSVDIRVGRFDLTLKGGAEIDLASITQGGAPIVTGQIILGGIDADAISHLTVKGDNTTGFHIGLGEANVGVRNLEINHDDKKYTINIPNIHIDGLSDTTLSFNKGRTGSAKHLNIFPGQLEGTVTSATVKNITVDIADIPKAAGAGK